MRALAVGGRALGVVGTREAGKSSTLAWLAVAGTEVLCDDLLVIDGQSTFKGPRTIDSARMRPNVSAPGRPSA